MSLYDPDKYKHFDAVLENYGLATPKKKQIDSNDKKIPADIVSEDIKEEPIVVENKISAPASITEPDKPIIQKKRQIVSKEVSIKEETDNTKTVLTKEDAELMARLLRARKISEASGIDINTVLLEMNSKKGSSFDKKREIVFKKDSDGNIISAEVFS